MHPQRPIIEEVIGSIGPTDHKSMVKLADKELAKYKKTADADVDRARMDRILGKVHDRVVYGQELVGKADAKQERNPRDLTSQPQKVEGERLTRIGKKAIATLDKYQDTLLSKFQKTGTFKNKELQSFARINNRNPDMNRIDDHGDEAYQMAYMRQAFKNK